MARKKNEKEKEIKKDKAETTNEGHTKAHTNRKSSKYRKIVEGYKRRNRLVEIIIVCIVLVLLFVLACNKTFLKTNYTQKVGNSEISIDLPRFTYFVKSDNKKIVFKTLRKSTNTRAFFQDFLESDKFDIYYCGDATPYYYNSEGKYFIYNIEVKKAFAIKTVTVNYSTVDLNLFCNTINDDSSDTESPVEDTQSGEINEGV